MEERFSNQIELEEGELVEQSWKCRSDDPNHVQKTVNNISKDGKEIVDHINRGGGLAQQNLKECIGYSDHTSKDAYNLSKSRNETAAPSSREGVPPHQNIKRTRGDSNYPQRDAFLQKERNKSEDVSMGEDVRPHQSWKRRRYDDVDHIQRDASKPRKAGDATAEVTFSQGRSSEQIRTKQSFNDSTLIRKDANDFNKDGYETRNKRGTLKDCFSSTAEEHPIVWPPVVIIENIVTGFDKTRKQWDGLKNNEIKSCLKMIKDLEYKKVSALYNRNGHCGTAVVVFEANDSGYMNAETLSQCLQRAGRGREDWHRVRPRCSLIDERDMEQWNTRGLVEDDGKRTIYGYLAKPSDMNRIKPSVHKLSIESYMKKVLEPMKRRHKVDAFQLQYEACKDVFRRDTFQLLSADFCEQSCTNDDPSTSFSILQSNRESGDTNHFNYKISTSGGLNRDFSNHEKENGDSIIGKTLNVGLTAMDNMLVENGSVTRLYHPVPCSSSQIMDFGVFISELNAVLLQQRNQLLYLTWRGIPALENLDSLPVHAEFHFFIRSLFHPTTSPQFIAEDAIIQRNLWVGAIVTSRIHFDALDNVHACISGTKLFHLYPPSALTYIYPNPWKEGALNNFSSIESIFLVNRAQHAKFFQNVKCWRAEVKAGEAIFIPAGWWHEVFTFQEAVSANIWFKPNPVARFRPTLMHLKSENYYKFMLQRTESS